jgi:hypothetical protein
MAEGPYPWLHRFPAASTDNLDGLTPGELVRLDQRFFPRLFVPSRKSATGRLQLSRMRGKLILAEAATGHPDGTVSMLRAGITHVWAETPPFPLQAALVARIETEMGDVGLHQAEIKCMDEDGQQVMPTIAGQFEAPQGGGNSTLILGFNAAFPKAGRYLFYLHVDKVERDAWPLTASVPPTKERKEGE